MGAQIDLDVAQGFAVGQLGEGHGEELVPTQYGKEVQIGCDLVGALAELNKIKRSALDIISR